MTTKYVCPVHPDFYTNDRPGICPMNVTSFATGGRIVEASEVEEGEQGLVLIGTNTVVRQVNGQCGRALVAQS